MKTIINRKIRTAIVGCGRISKNHFDSLKKHKDNMELVSICDNQKDILSEHEKKYNIKGYRNLCDMLDKENLDVVIICSPSGLQAEQKELCAKSNGHLVREKNLDTK